MFRAFEQPTWDSWRASIIHYERQGSENFKFPIGPEDPVPAGCPATLAYQEPTVVHEFMYASSLALNHRGRVLMLRPETESSAIPRIFTKDMG